MVKIVHIQFQDTNFAGISYDDGSTWIIIGQVCRWLGKAPHAVMRWLMSSPWCVWRKIAPRDSAFAVDMASFYEWMKRASKDSKHNTKFRPKGYIYYAQSSNGLVKVGFSLTPQERVSAIRHASPDTGIRMVAVSRGTYATEGTIHAAFDEERVHGEWFRLSDRMVRHIEDVRIANVDTMVGNDVACDIIGLRA